MNRVIALLVALATSGVVAEENGWSSSWGPGTQANYTVTLAGTTLLTIICRDDAPLTMLATVSGRDYGSDSRRPLALLVDGQRYDAPYRQGTSPRSGRHFATQHRWRYCCRQIPPSICPPATLQRYCQPLGRQITTVLRLGHHRTLSHSDDGLHQPLQPHPEGG